jgi:hypothetical protein
MIDNYIELFKKKIEKMENKVRKFKLISLSMLYGEYKWGEETPESSDCSGTICLPLMVMGYSVRVTAERLRQLFKETAFEYSDNELQAVFYIKDSKAKHVTPIIGEGMVVNAQGGKEIKLEKALDVIKRYKDKGYKIELRKLDFKDLENIDEVHGLDKELV